MAKSLTSPHWIRRNWSTLKQLECLPANRSTLNHGLKYSWQQGTRPMESKHLFLPRRENTEPANSLAYRLARQQLAGVSNIEEQCSKGGAQYNVTGSGESITVQYLNRTYLITLPDVEISLADNAEAVPI